MSKRKFEWACPVCLDTIEEGAVPSVLSGCTPFAHVVCVKCVAGLGGLCPKCRAPFHSFRPLADFVDSDDKDVADVLAKQARIELTLDQRLAALDIADPLVRRRVVFRARNLAAFVAQMRASGLRARYQWVSRVPDFDALNVPLTVKRARELGMRVTLAALHARMRVITDEVVPHLTALFAGKVRIATCELAKLRYMPLRVTRLD